MNEGDVKITTRRHGERVRFVVVCRELGEIRQKAATILDELFVGEPWGIDALDLWPVEVWSGKRGAHRQWRAKVCASPRERHSPDPTSAEQAGGVGGLGDGA